MSLSTIYGIIVVKCGIDPNYFLDEMTPHEVNASMEAYMETYKDSWEIARHLKHAIYSSQSTKKIKITDVMPFPWDTDEVKGIKKMDSETLTKLQEIAILHNKKNKDGKGV